MFVGVLRLRLHIPGARSLKDKRSVVRSLKERAQSRLKVSIAEVAMLDHPQHAVLADRATEIVPFGEGGMGVRGGIEHALDGGAAGADWDEEETP